MEKNLGFNYIKKANIILIIFNLFDIKELIKDFIEKINKKKEENSLIYLIGNKFKKNKVEDQQKIEDFRNYAKKLIEQKKLINFLK